MPTVCARNSRNSIYLGYFRSAAILKSYYDNSGHQNWCKSILSFIAVMMTHIRCYIYIKLIQYGLTILKEYPQRNKKKYFLSVLRFYSHFHVFLLKPQLCLFAAFVFFPTLQLFHVYLQAKQAKSPMETNGTSPLTRLITLSSHSWKNAWNHGRTLQSAEKCCCGVKMSKILKIYDGAISYGFSVQ